MKTLLQDLRYGLRLLAKNPGFAAVAVLTLGLGIGSNAAIFSLVDAVLLRPLPYPAPDQLVGLGQWRDQKGEGYIQTGVSAPNAEDIARSGIFRNVAYYRGANFNITEGSTPESVSGVRASSELLPMFGIPPLLGRFLTREETEEGHDQVAVIGYRLWQTRYAADPGILGKTLDLNQRRYTIVGVMPASFRFTWDSDMDVFVPLVLTPEERSETGRGTSRDLQTQARLKPGISVVQAQAAMNSLAANLARQYPAADEGWGIKVEPLHAAYHRQMQTPLAVMLGAVLFVLLIACVNVANLLLARASGRKREISIRIAMGAARGRLIRQLLTESLLLAVAGGALGLALAYAGDRLLTIQLSRHFNLPNAKIIEIDWRVLLFSVAVTVSTGLIFGLAPSWTALKAGLSDSLKESGLNISAGAGRRRLRNALVVCEMALALVLLTGAGLLVRTFVELANVDLGIEPANAITLFLSLPAYKYPSATGQASFYHDLTEKMGALPGVRSVGAQGGGGSVFFLPEGQAQASPGQEPTATYKTVTPDFLKAIGTHLLAGRQFAVSDNADGAPVAIISETVARRYWPDANPIGRHLAIVARTYSGQKSDLPRPLQIVGIAKDVRNGDLWRPEPAIYVPFSQSPSPNVFLVARTSVAPMSVAGALRDAVLSLDRDQPIRRIRSMSENVADTYGTLRFPMTLLWIFSALALILSAIGIFGVMSYTVSRRTQELALRMALGADRYQVLRLVLSEGLSVTVLGVAIGLVGALALSRLMAGYVYGITPYDPLTFALASLLLSGVALFASYIPARRAARIDPTIALRYE